MLHCLGLLFGARIGFGAGDTFLEQGGMLLRIILGVVNPWIVRGYRKDRWSFG